MFKKFKSAKDTKKISDSVNDSKNSIHFINIQAVIEKVAKEGKYSCAVDIKELTTDQSDWLLDQLRGLGYSLTVSPRYDITKLIISWE